MNISALMPICKKFYKTLFSLNKIKKLRKRGSPNETLLCASSFLYIILFKCVHHDPKAHIEKVGEDKSRICLVLFLKIYQQIWKVENEDDKIIDIKIAETL
jgi:hypothetical protein